MNRKFLKTIIIGSMVITVAGCSPSTTSTQPSETPATIETPIEPIKEATEQPTEGTKDEPKEVEELQQGPLEGEFADAVLSFAENLKNKDYKAVCQSMGMIDTTYDFLNDIDVSSYSVRRLQEDEMDQRYTYNEQYEITLKVEHSSNPRIPVGISKWFICGPDVASEFSAFIPVEEMVKEVSPDNGNIPLQYDGYKDLYCTACNFSFATGCFEADANTIEQIPLNVGTLHLFMHYLSPLENEGKMTVEDFKASIWQHYGIAVKDEEMQAFIDNLLEKGDILEGPDNQIINTWNCGHGLGNYVTSIKEAKSIGDQQKVIQIQYYGDCSYFYGAKLVEYTFEQGEEGIWQLKKVKTLEDTGYELGIESV